MRRRRLQRTTRRDAQTVDVTAFLSLMVILVPFLLVTAVFSRTTILDVMTTGEQQRAVADALQLQVVVRSRTFEISHTGREGVEIVDRAGKEASMIYLAELARRLKARYPLAREATVLVEQEIAYEVVVRVLDVLRVHARTEGDAWMQDSLFPQIALGPAPRAGQGGVANP
jgi:biopolymer transport protein ExbD